MNSIRATKQNKLSSYQISSNMETQFDDQLEYIGVESSDPVTDQKLSSHNRYFEKQEHKLNKYMCLSFFIICLMNFGWLVVQAHYSQGSQDQLLEVQKWNELISANNKLQNYQPENYYWFSVSTRDLILNSDLENVYKRNRTFFEINRSTHLRAILLTQMTHNIDFKGNAKVELSPFETDVRKKEKVMRTLMDSEQIYYEDNYQISQYENVQLPFCLIVPSYNNAESKLYLRNLDSIFMQDYSNYRVIYIDDKSPDKTGQFVNQYAKEKNIPKQKITVIINDVNKKAMKNIYEAVHNHCRNGQIVGIIDGDDSLNGRQVLKLFNTLYHRKKLAFLYSNFLKITDNSLTEFGFGNQVTQQYFQSGKLRNSATLVCTHFMTFYADLFKMAKKEDFTYENGTFFDYAYDRAIITPLLQLSYPRNFYLPEMVYEYRHDTGINDADRQWYRVSDMIQARPPYKSLKTFQFVDQHEIIKQGDRILNKI